MSTRTIGWWPNTPYLNVREQAGEVAALAAGWSPAARCRLITYLEIGM